MVKKCFIPLGLGFLVLVLLFSGCATAPEQAAYDPMQPGEDIHDANTRKGNNIESRWGTEKPGDSAGGSSGGGSAASSASGSVPNVHNAVMVPGESYSFWNSIMTYDTISRYKAQGYRTFCNLFLGDTLRSRFGDKIFSMIFPNGVLDPNVIHNEWQYNPNLIRLGPDEYTIQDIQNLADEGYLIVLSYTWTWGHLAFVGNRNLQVNTVPASPMINGQNGADLDPMFLPIVVQAGSYTGVTSCGYASNGWIDAPGYPLFQNGTVRFYLVKQ